MIDWRGCTEAQSYISLSRSRSASRGCTTSGGWGASKNEKARGTRAGTAPAAPQHRRALPHTEASKSRSSSNGGRGSRRMPQHGSGRCDSKMSECTTGRVANRKSSRAAHAQTHARRTHTHVTGGSAAGAGGANIVIGQHSHHACKFTRPWVRSRATSRRARHCIPMTCAVMTQHYSSMVAVSSAQLPCSTLQSDASSRK